MMAPGPLFFWAKRRIRSSPRVFWASLSRRKELMGSMVPEELTNWGFLVVQEESRGKVEGR
jgi:hypothetical protein